MGILGVALALGGCTSVDLEFPALPEAEALDWVRPGVTTRSQVLLRLGPPEEMRRPAPFERARLSAPQYRRILEAGDVFGRDAYTYVSGRRSLRTFGILPIGPPIFRIAWRRSTEERWRIEFDADDRVRSVSFRAAPGSQSR